MTNEQHIEAIAQATADFCRAARRGNRGLGQRSAYKAYHDIIRYHTFQLEGAEYCRAHDLYAATISAARWQDLARENRLTVARRDIKKFGLDAEWTLEAAK